MALKVKQNFVIEDITDENGNKLGQIKFNPNDSRIMARLTRIVKDCSGYIEELKELGDFQELSNKKLETIEDFEKVSESFEKLNKGFETEEKAVDNIIDNLSEIFGKDTINIFTCGTKDVEMLMPLIEYILPYIKEARSKKVNEYMPKKEAEVFE